MKDKDYFTLNDVSQIETPKVTFATWTSDEVFSIIIPSGKSEVILTKKQAIILRDALIEYINS